MGHLERVEIPPERLVRWREAARRPGEAGIGLQLELADVERDPSRHMLRRAARAARMAKRQVTGVEAQIANATATGIEEAAEA
jgi:hypothetical protein